MQSHTGLNKHCIQIEACWFNPAKSTVIIVQIFTNFENPQATRKAVLLWKLYSLFSNVHTQKMHLYRIKKQLIVNEWTAMNMGVKKRGWNFHKIYKCILLLCSEKLCHVWSILTKSLQPTSSRFPINHCLCLGLIRSDNLISIFDAILNINGTQKSVLSST